VSNGTGTGRDPLDAELARRFARLRADDQRAAPPLGPLLANLRARPSRSPLRRRLILAAGGGAVAAAVAIALALTLGARPEEPGAPAVDVGRLVEIQRRTWAAPSDFLLAPPEQDLARTVPRVGYPYVTPTTTSLPRRPS
jgi:hypothetical protein